MITRRTKIQLIVFVIITLVGVSFVGARYARLDRVVRDDAYAVTAHFSEAGGIFAGAEVTYRGVGIGSVDELVLTDSGVDVVLEIQNEWDAIPADTVALVGNRSAVGEQYVELQPKVDDGPFLVEGSEIANLDTRTPIATEKLLGDLATTVGSVDRQALATTIDELGRAFQGSGPDLQRIIDTGNSFIRAADRNFDVTTALIEDSNVVLRGQLATQSSLRTFAQQLSLFSNTLANNDADLRTLLDSVSPGLNEIRSFIQENRIDIESLLNNAITTGDIIVRRLDGLKQILVIYPYVVEGGVTVASRSDDTGLVDAHFGLIITDSMPCLQGYDPGERRPPQELEDLPMDLDAACTEPPTQSNPRGAQNIPRPATSYRDAPVVATFDPDTGLRWGSRDDESPLLAPGTVAPRSLGRESWKWLYLQPLTGR